MSAAGRLAAFALVLGLVFGGGWAIGSAVGPIDDAPPVTAPAHGTGHGTAEP